MAGADASPWVFRNRAPLIGLAFLTASLGGLALGPLSPFRGLQGVLSLPPSLLIGSASPGGASLVPLLLPVGIGLVGFGLRWWGTSHLRGHVMADRRLHSDRLIVAGPFRFVRNPLYLGNLFLMAGFCLFFPPPALPTGLLGMGTVVACLARVEAKALRARHGAAYDAYASQVPAFLPTFRPAPASATVQPAWRNGLASEMWALLLLAYLAAAAARRPGVALAVGALMVLVLAWRGVRNRRLRAGAVPVKGRAPL